MRVFDPLLAEIAELRPVRHFGRIIALRGGMLLAQGLAQTARLGDRVRITRAGGGGLEGEIVALGTDGAEILPEEPAEGAAVDDPVEHLGRNGIAPCDAWIGRVIDPGG